MQPLDQHLTTPENITKIPQNSTKKQITTTFWKTCKPHQHHLGIQIPIHQNRNTILGRQKRTSAAQEQGWRIRAVISAGKGKGNESCIIIEKPTEDKRSTWLMEEMPFYRTNVLINLPQLSRKSQPLLCFTLSGLYNQFFHLHQLVSFILTLVLLMLHP